MNNEIETLKAKLDKLNAQYNELKNQKDEDKKKLDQDKIDFEKQIAEHKTKQQKYEENHTNMLQEKSELDNLKKKLEKQQAELDSMNKSENELIEELRKKLEVSETENTNLKILNDNLSSDLGSTKAQLQSANIDIQSKITEIQTLTNDNVGKDNQIAELQEKLRLALEQVQQYDILKTTHSQIVTEFETTKSELVSIKENCKIHSQTLQKLENKVNELDVVIARKDNEISNLSSSHKE